MPAFRPKLILAITSFTRFGRGRRYTKAAKAAYIGWKIFQAVRLLHGDLTVAVEIAAGVIVEGAIDVTLEAAMAALYNIMSTWGKWQSLGQDVYDFGNLMTRLASELRESSPAGAARMSEAAEKHAQFLACDANGDGRVSRMEFSRFADEFGYSPAETGQLFDSIDRNGDGE